MHILIGQWRDKAREFRGKNDYAYAARAAMLEKCAAELERAWHDDWHNAAWSPELCALCRDEMGRDEE
jgi:hypothetical protein